MAPARRLVGPGSLRRPPGKCSSRRLGSETKEQPVFFSMALALLASVRYALTAFYIFSPGKRALLLRLIPNRPTQTRSPYSARV